MLSFLTQKINKSILFLCFLTFIFPQFSLNLKAEILNAEDCQKYTHDQDAQLCIVNNHEILSNATYTGTGSQNNIYFRVGATVKIGEGATVKINNGSTYGEETSPSPITLNIEGELDIYNMEVSNSMTFNNYGTLNIYYSETNAPAQCRYGVCTGLSILAENTTITVNSYGSSTLTFNLDQLGRPPTSGTSTPDLVNPNSVITYYDTLKVNINAYDNTQIKDDLEWAGKTNFYLGENATMQSAKAMEDDLIDTTLASSFSLNAIIEGTMKGNFTSTLGTDYITIYTTAKIGTAIKQEDRYIKTLEGNDTIYFNSKVMNKSVFNIDFLIDGGEGTDSFIIDNSFINLSVKLQNIENMSIENSNFFFGTQEASENINSNFSAINSKIHIDSNKSSFSTYSQSGGNLYLTIDFLTATGTTPGTHSGTINSQDISINNSILRIDPLSDNKEIFESLDICDSYDIAQGDCEEKDTCDKGDCYSTIIISDDSLTSTENTMLLLDPRYRIHEETDANTNSIEVTTDQNSYIEYLNGYTDNTVALIIAEELDKILLEESYGEGSFKDLLIELNLYEGEELATNLEQLAPINNSLLFNIRDTLGKNFNDSLIYQTRSYMINRFQYEDRIINRYKNDNFSIWASFTNPSTQRTDTDLIAGTQSDYITINFGVDSIINPNFIVGFGSSASIVTTNTIDDINKDNFITDSYSFGIYGIYKKNNLYSSFVVSDTIDITYNKRYIDFSEINQKYKSTIIGNNISILTEQGINYKSFINFNPFFSFGIGDISQFGYKEKSYGDQTDESGVLEVKGYNSFTIQTNIGIRVNKDIRIDNKQVLTPNIGIALEKNFYTNYETVSQFNASESNSYFSIPSVNYSKNVIKYNFSLIYKFYPLQLTFDTNIYRGDFQNNSSFFINAKYIF